MRVLLTLNRAKNPSVLRKGLPAVLLCLLLLPGLSPAQIVINELMYHPYEPFGVTNDAEFIEIHNAGTGVVDLSNYRFDNGISFNFPTNTVIGGSNYIVLCENLTAFSAAYPSVTNCIGTFSGNLNNGGERVTLSRKETNSWETVDTIRYVDIGSSDGEGPSLELVNPGFARLRNHCHGAWAPSTGDGGTPGTQNSVYDQSPPPVVADTIHTPVLPPEGSSVTITCRAAAYDTDELAEVALLYRVSTYPEQVWTNATMEDEGLNGDEVKNDGIYSVVIPPYGEDTYTAGTIVEFQIRVTDDHAESLYAPGTNTTSNEIGIPDPPYSYLVKFGEDTDYTGEYDTYHILLTERNRSASGIGLEVRSKTSDKLLDATLVTSDGDIFYNCGVRFRGGSSRSNTYGGYRIELPKSRKFESYREINLNHLSALDQYMGLEMANRVGAGVKGQDVELSRVWINGVNKLPNHGIYTRIEGFDNHIIHRHYGDDDWGNLYKCDGDGTYDGDLRYTADLNEYIQNSSGDKYYNYMFTSNNPPDLWTELQDLCYEANKSGDNLTTITNRVNVRAWARLYALQVCVANQESGWLDPYSTRGDELRLYAHPITGVFDLYPWDMDTLLGTSSSAVWNWNHAATRNFLFHKPMAPYYIGDVLDILDGVMSDENMNKFWDDMGSALVNQASVRTTWQNNLNSLRTNLKNAISTNFAIQVSDAVASGEVATVVNASTITLSGDFPQNYTADIKVNGVSAGIDSWDVANMGTTYGTWSTAANGTDLALGNGTTEVSVETVDSDGNVLLSRDLTIVRKISSVNKSGSVSVNATWDSSGGIIVVTGNVDVGSKATLTIASNTTVLIESGKTISVSSGSLVIEGTEDAPVWILPSDGASSWTIDAGDQSVTASNAVFAGGTITANGGTVLLQDCEIRDNSASGGIITSSGGASVTLRRCVVSGYAKTSFSSSSLLTDNCLFEDMSDAGIEIISGVATVESSTVMSPAGSGSPDGIRASSSATVLVTNSLVHSVAGTGVSALSSSSIECIACLIHSSGTGMKISGASLVNLNNTIANNTTGIEGSQSVTNCIIWSNTASVASGTSQVQYTDLEQSGTNSYSGTGNLNQNPWFRDSSIADYRLQSFSPCIGGGAGGADMGTSFPVGANPPTPTGVSLTNGLTSGTNFITLSWTVNDHDDATIEIQRSIEGDDWTTITTLAAGSTNHTDTGLIQNTEYHYRLRASHDRGASFWSDSAILVTANEATTEMYKNYLRITEIMYNPDGSDDAEFIEVQNTWSNAMDMTGLFLDQGRYSFATGMVLAAGDSFIIARDGIGFSNAYPGVECEGTFTSYDLNLDNGGESLWIKDATGEKVFEVDYNDAAPWPTAADGDGPSLVLIDPSATPPENGDYDYTRWRASTLYDGSPGYADPNGSVVINEVLSHQDDPAGDWIELHNPGNAPIDISGYYISDDAANRMKFQVPATTEVAAGDFVVFNERDDFGPVAIGVSGFALSELGEAVYLSDTNGTNITSQSFGAAERDFTFGRHTRSDGQVDFVAMSSQTSDATNSYPKVGPIVINEIMYNPSATGKEFVEILNISSSTVPLSVIATNGLGSVFTNGWEFDGAMDFTFPTNTSLASGEHLILTSIEPAEFRALFGVSPGTQVFGPFSGDLDNGGETVELYKPGGPETNGVVPLILVDMVEYDNNLPWPDAADNDGPSLERITPEVYGNEPTNWTASSIGGTPGQSNNAAALPSVGFEFVDSSGDESNQTVTVAVMVYPVSTNNPVTVNYATTGGTATPVTDYTSTSGSLLFWPYDSRKFITLTIQADGVALEPDETVEISLTSVSANAVPGGNSVHTYTILDTDIGTLNPPTITPDSTNFFDSIVVSMETDNTNAVIRYTTDGTTPTLDDKLYSLPLTLTASARIKAKSFLGIHNASTETSELFLEKTPDRALPTGIFSSRISASSDDAEQAYQPPFAGNPCYVDEDDIFLGDELPSSPWNRMYAGFRFREVTIPPGATVTNAYIQFTSSGSGSGQATHTIYAEAANDPGTFQNAQFNISARTPTDASVSWSPDDWLAADLAGTAQRTPDLSGVIQDVIDRDGWAESNSLVIVVEYEADEPYSFNLRPAHTYDADPSKAALLFVQYTTNSVPPSYTLQGTAHSWLDTHAPTNILNYEAADYEDWDGDFALNWEEYPAGTIPTNLTSVFKVLSVDYMSGSNRVTWYGTTDSGITKPFSMYRSTNALALDLWELIQSNSITRDASGTNEWWDVPAPEDVPAFYQPAILPPWDE